MVAAQLIHVAACRELKAAGERPSIRRVAELVGAHRTAWHRAVQGGGSPRCETVRGWLATWAAGGREPIALELTAAGWRLRA